MTVSTGDRVLVTGAASGLGLALVTRLLERGCRVLATDVHLDLPSSLAALSGNLTYRQLDVRSDDDWSTTLGWVRETWSGIDLVVNNAGVASGGRIDLTTSESWDWLTQINLLGVARGCRTFAPMLKEQRSGHVVNTASAAGLVHPPRMTEYTAVKAGVVALSESLRWELEPYGVGVSVVCPSFFRTNLADSIRSADPAAKESARRLIEGSSRSADSIAVEVLRQLDAGKHVILPDRDARVAYAAKRFAPWLYRAMMLRTARQAAAEDEASGGARRVGARVSS
ncbi:SDR family NAD(P)-dependent oxidoreductase [Mumia zhuanghuii]|uniref:SDR family NAD(P)-dependent oxidoreductase n=2 Tax=Mumia TaxID=1546255 RepID=A0ABW1QI05_9ACTN|nr:MULTISPECIES: SDR family NAD(P)-dependent oxidoreductase [Mumia]KAA1424628.1 SDR family NAD(P)-dependent oxidoreductase [Mumia zhuanghuii]